MRNGNRWRVASIDTKRNLLGAERLDDGARVLFNPDYFREQVSLGYAVTAHSAQGVTADTSIAVLREDTSRNLLYVAMTRGRHANHAHIYKRSTEASEFSHEGPVGTHIVQRGESGEAANLIRRIVVNDEPTITAHSYATHTQEEALPHRVRSLLTQRAIAAQHRNENYQAWKTQRQERDHSMEAARDRQVYRGQHRSADHGIEL